MRLSKAWTVASKDFKIFRKKRNIVYSIVSFEILVSVILPLVIAYSNSRKGISASVLPGLINSFSYWFVIGSAILPMSVSSYSLIGEKVQKSLEPLLATPTTDEEILAGKSISAALPAIASTYIGAVIFMTLIDLFTHSKLSYWFYPNWNIAVILLLLAPLATIFSIGVNILISSRSNDVRAAQQFGAMTIAPLAAVYILSEINVIFLSVTNLLIMAAVLAVADVIVFYLAKATFQREEILTRWK